MEGQRIGEGGGRKRRDSVDSSRYPAPSPGCGKERKHHWGPAESPASSLHQTNGALGISVARTKLRGLSFLEHPKRNGQN